MRLLGRFECVKVQQIQMDWLAIKHGMTILITVEGQELDEHEANLLAYRDGFRTRGIEGALGEMHDYWHHLHGHAAFPFSGDLIHWKFSAHSANAQLLQPVRNGGFERQQKRS